MPRATLIHNRTAGSGRVTESALRALAVDQGYRADYASTDDDLDQALQDPGDLVVAAGGDGTVGKVARRLTGRGIPLVILALGTANNVARGLGLPVTGGLDALAFDWQSAGRRRLDVWTATGPWGAHRFVESFGIGVFAAAMPILSALKQRADLSEDPERVLTHDRAGLAALTRAYRALPLELTADAGAEAGAYVLVEALNVPGFGPGLRLAPGADPSDGRLDLVAAGEADREALADWMSLAGSNGQTARAAPLDARRVRSVSFRWRGEPLHIDGRPWGGEATPWAKARMVRAGQGKRVTLRLEPEAVAVLVPRS